MPRCLRHARYRAALALLTAGLTALAAVHQARLRSIAVRLLSHRVPNPVSRRGIRVDLGPASGEWIQVPLAADLTRALSGVVGEPTQAAAYSRFGGFAARRSYSAYLDPTSRYYQAWIGAYVVLDGPEGRRFGFDAEGRIDPGDALDVLEADQRMVYRSAGCPKRFPGDRCTRPVGPLAVEPLEIAGEKWWRLTGEAETWSTYCKGGHPNAPRRGRWLYGVVPAVPPSPAPDFHPIRYVGEFWLRHDGDLGATCAVFLIAPRHQRPEAGFAPEELLLAEAPDLLGRIRFVAATQLGRG